MTAGKTNWHRAQIDGKIGRGHTKELPTQWQASGHSAGRSHEPPVPVIVVLLIVIIGLMFYATYLLDARERLLNKLESTVKGATK